MKSLILAAGYATRLYPLTLNTPKALLKIGGKPMMDYLVEEIATLPRHDRGPHRLQSPLHRSVRGMG